MSSSTSLSTGQLAGRRACATDQTRTAAPAELPPTRRYPPPLLLLLLLSRAMRAACAGARDITPPRADCCGCSLWLTLLRRPSWRRLLSCGCGCGCGCGRSGGPGCSCCLRRQHMPWSDCEWVCCGHPSTKRSTKADSQVRSENARRGAYAVCRKCARIKTQCGRRTRSVRNCRV